MKESILLVLDDDESYIFNIEDLMRERGIEVISVDTNEAALVRLRSGVDNVLVDWNLNPKGEVGGPYTEEVIRKALATGINTVYVRSGTDDSTGRLVALQNEFGERLDVGPKYLGDELSPKLNLPSMG